MILRFFSFHPFFPPVHALQHANSCRCFYRTKPTFHSLDSTTRERERERERRKREREREREREKEREREREYKSNVRCNSFLF